MPVFDIPLYGFPNRWQEYMQISPWWWNQFAGLGDLAPLSTGGANVWVQPDWDDLGAAISDAIELFAVNLGFYPRPVYLTERIPLGRGRPYELQSLRTTYGHIQAIGTRGTTLLQAGVAVVYSDTDGDGVNDRGTVQFAYASAPDESEIQMFFTVADINLPGAQAADERYQIEPATVVVSGGNITLTAHAAFFGQPELWRQPYIAPNYNPQNKNVLDTQDAANFVTEVDVYRVYPDETNAVTLRRRQPDCTNCQWEWYTAAGVANIEDSRLGTFNLSEADCGCWRGGWKYVDISYYAGYPLNRYGQPEPSLTRALIRLTNQSTMQPRQPNTFNNVIAQRDQSDNLFPSFGNSSAPLEMTPFGGTNGAVAAWNMVKRYMIPEGGALNNSR